MIKSLFFILVIILVFGFCNSCTDAVGEDIAVERMFYWTASGDDVLMGYVEFNEGRYSEAIEELENNWDSCAVWIDSLHSPAMGGQPDSHLACLTVETGIVYHFAIKAFDEMDNESPLSNIVALVWNDTTAPAQITDLR